MTFDLFKRLNTQRNISYDFSYDLHFGETVQGATYLRKKTSTMSVETGNARIRVLHSS